MQARLGPLAVEVTEPESERYTASLVLVHGLWDVAAAWRRVAGFLAHRGWRCVAADLRGRAASAPDIGALVADLRAAIAALDAPPVVVGHDLGAFLALHLADAARACVALAPLVPPPLGPQPHALRQAGTWWARRRGAALAPPGGRWCAAYPQRDPAVCEPAPLLRQLLSGAPVPRPAGQIPAAVFISDGDPVTARAAAETLARATGAELFLSAGGGHALGTGPDWEDRAAAMHRWIIQRLGVELLALYDEAMAGE